MVSSKKSCHDSCIIITVTRDNTDATISTMTTSNASFVVIGGAQKVNEEL